MPLSALDDKGVTVPVTLRDVRIVPSFSDSLLSVNAMWEASSTECRFADVRSILSPPMPKGGRLVLPFHRKGGLYLWRVATRVPQPSSPPVSTRSRCLAIHASRTHHHHVNIMSAPEAADCMHNRLHAGNTRLRALPAITADAPSSLAQARH
eukprot:5150447-Pleurochrysis_carterae.AAC.1